MKELLHGCNWLRWRVNRHWREAHRKETFVQPCLQTRWVQAFKRLYRPVQPRQSKSEFHGSARANAEWMYSPSPESPTEGIRSIGSSRSRMESAPTRSASLIKRETSGASRFPIGGATRGSGGHRGSTRSGRTPVGRR